MGFVLASGAEQPGDTLVRLARIHAQVSGHVLDVLGPHDRAIRGLLIAAHHGFGKGPAARLGAGAAVGVREHFLDAENARVLPHPKTLVHQRDHEAEKQPHAAENQGRIEDGDAGHARF